MSTSIAIDQFDGIYRGPFPGQQTKFVERTEREVFFGGAGGGGKSVNGMGKFGQQLSVENQRWEAGSITNSKAWGIYLRRTMPDLIQAIDRSHQIFKDIDPLADYNVSSHLWTFPSCANAHFQFGHMENEASKYKYKSSEFCAAKGTRVLVWSERPGTTLSIEDIQVGYYVMTLAGPRRVTHVHRTGVKPCVRVTTKFRGEIVGTQVHPTTHPVLLWPSDGSTPSPSLGSLPSPLRARPRGLIWQDYESLLDGAPESREIRASRVDAESGFARCDGVRLEPWRLPPSKVELALHAPAVRRAAQHSFSPMELSAALASPPPSADRPQGAPQPSVALGYDLGQGLGDVQSVPAYGTALPAACGASDAQTGQETQSSLSASCWSSSDPHDVQALHLGVIGQGHALQQGSAETSNPTRSREGDPAPPGRDTRCTGQFYPHFYTGEQRPTTEEILRGEGEIEWAGWFETFDLTVEGENHYITESGIVNAQTYVFFDELTEFSETMYEYMDTRIRTSDPILANMLQLCSASNPDGAGLLWVRKRFIEKKEPEVTYRKLTRLRDGRVMNYDSVFIPAKLDDNPVLLAQGNYEASLLNKRPEVREAILHGNWYVNPGAFLADIWDTPAHVVPNHPVPKNAHVFRMCDPGLTAPSAVLWAYVDSEQAMTVFHALNVRNHDAAMLAGRIREIEMYYGYWDDEANESTLNGPIDEDAFSRNLAGGPSYAKVMKECGIRWVRSKKDRFNGTAEVVRRLNSRVKSLTPGVADRPMLRFMERCTSPIETLPVLQADPNDPNDVDTKGNDHDWDAVRYGCMYRRLFGGKKETDDDDDLDNVADMSEYRRRGSGTLGTPPGGW